MRECEKGCWLVLSALLVSAASATGCGITANWFFSGEPPQATAPRFALSAARLEELQAQGYRALRHAGPFWDPSTEERQACEAALWRRLHWSGLQDELATYTHQFHGVIERGRPRVRIHGEGPRHWRRTRQLEPERDPLPFLLGFHAGRDEFLADCDPRAAAILRFLFSTGMRR